MGGGVLESVKVHTGGRGEGGGWSKFRVLLRTNFMDGPVPSNQIYGSFDDVWLKLLLPMDNNG